ncbi:MAG: PD-(D/E)XK nuclease family transposase [Acidaminococcaceae bacterium]|nr:PD-(D/E)XK nuclease family transposase [Acidaminococcaceae bacterium]
MADEALHRSTLQDQLDLQDKLQRIAKMRMFDDTLMNAVFDSRISETEVLIQIILDRDDIKVTSTKTQEEFINVYGRMVTLDIVARDADNKLYNIEVQRDKYKAPPQRARFHAAVTDITLLKDRQPFKEMPERYTIFIIEEDKFNRGLPVYHVENKIAELNDEPFCDGGHIIYVNGGYRNLATPIGQLMHDFACTQAKDILNPVLRERVRYLKESEGGTKEMCELVEEYAEKKAKRYAAEREMQVKLKSAKNLLENTNLSLEEIAKYVELPLAAVEELAHGRPA